MCSDAWFYNIFMYLYNKNILEYAQIAQNGTESKIPFIESHACILDKLWKDTV